MFDSFIGLVGICMEHEFDIADSTYDLSADQVRPVHGKLKYAFKDNPFFKP